jgi:hypothetical protein
MIVNPAGIFSSRAQLDAPEKLYHFVRARIILPIVGKMPVTITGKVNKSNKPTQLLGEGVLG